MSDRIYNVRISPEVINGDIFLIDYTGNSYNEEFDVEICCDIFTSAVTKTYTGQTFVYSSMTEVLSGGTYNTGTTQYNSLLTNITSCPHPLGTLHSSQCVIFGTIISY